jgi:chromosome partitioning protein
MSAKVICFTNCKGGVAKTTSAVNVATQLRLKKKKVLLIDLDPQGDASYMMGLTKDDVGAAHIGHALIDPQCFKKTIYAVEFLKKDGNKKSHRDFYISPAHPQLAEVENSLMTKISRERILKECIDSVRQEYDFIIIDCAPSLGVCTVNALAASDYYVLVVDSEPLAMKNIAPNTDVVRIVQGAVNSDLKLLSVLFTKYDNQTSLHRQVVENVTEVFDGNVFKNKIPKNIEIAESAGSPLCGYAPRSKGCLAYVAVTEELLKKIKKRES